MKKTIIILGLTAMLLLGIVGINFSSIGQEGDGILGTAEAVGNSPPIFKMTKTYQNDEYTGCDDSFLYLDSMGDDNFGQYGYNVVSNDYYRTVIRFSNLGIPAGSTIVSANLEGYWYKIDNNGNNISIYGIKKPWLESEVTYIEYSLGNSWEIWGAKGSLD